MSNYRILLLDYEPRSIAQTKLPLEAAGFEVEVATDGLAGIEAFNRMHPDLVLIEAMLPKKHGFEVCQEIKRTPEGKRTPIVITTGVYRGHKYRSQALHIHGCDEYLEKPFASDLLISLCTRFLNGGKTAAPAEAESPEPLQASEALSDIAKVVDEMSATEPSHSYAASIVADLTEEEIIARLDALLPGDAMAGQAIRQEKAAEHREVTEEICAAEAAPLDPAMPPAEDLLEPLTEEAETGTREAAEPGVEDRAGAEDLPEAAVEAAEPPEALWIGAEETQEPTEERAASAAPSRTTVSPEAEEEAIESLVEEKFAEILDEKPEPESPQVVPFDASRSRKKRRERSGAPSRPASGAPAADAVAAAQPALPEVAEDEPAPLPSVATAAPEVHLEPPVRVARPTATPVPAPPSRSGALWVAAVAAVVVAFGVYFLVFKPAASEKALPLVSQLESAPQTSPAETVATPPAEAAPKKGAAAGTARRDPAKPTGAPREAVAEDTAQALPERSAPAVTRVPPAEEARSAAPPAVQKPAPVPAEAVARPDGQGRAVDRKAPEPAAAAPAATETPVPKGAEAAPAAPGEDAAKPVAAEIVPPATPEPAVAEVARPSTARGALVSIEDVDTPPVAKSRPSPKYTTRARMLRQQGAVLLNLLVDENGNVAEVEVLQEIPASDLNDAALRAARAWTYHPATKDGVPVKVWKQEKINFTF